MVWFEQDDLVFSRTPNLGFGAFHDPQSGFLGGGSCSGRRYTKHLATAPAVLG